MEQYEASSFFCLPFVFYDKINMIKNSSGSVSAVVTSNLYIIEKLKSSIIAMLSCDVILSNNDDKICIF